MKRFQTILFFGMLSVGANAAMADSASLNSFPSRVLPVLVQVNSHGRVTDASPATELSPPLNRLLRKNLDELISKPATDKHGRPMSSQFVINVALQASPRKEGDYDAQFAYVSSSPVPSGSWYWVHIDGHRLALASRNSFDRVERPHFNYNREVNREVNYSRTPTPPIQNTSRGALSAPPAPGH
jgi:hypothetical protein